jgi:hypothetical protein
LRFSTTEQATLPADEEALVPIIAMDPGPGGNLPAGSIDTVDGALGLSIRVSNPNSTSGGANQLRSTVTNQDMQDIELELSLRLLDEAQDEMEAQLDPNEQLAAESLQVGEVLVATYDAVPGEFTETLGFSTTLLVTGLAFKIDDVEILAQSALTESLPQNRGARPGTLDIESIDGTIHLNLSMLTVISSQSTYEVMDMEALKNQVRGKTVEDAVSLLVEDYGLAATPTVITSPSWFNRLPWLNMRIDVRWVWEALS